MNATHPIIVTHTSKSPGMCRRGDWTTQRHTEGPNTSISNALLSVASVCLVGSARELHPPVARPQTRNPVASARRIDPIYPLGRAASLVGVWCRAMKHLTGFCF